MGGGEACRGVGMEHARFRYPELKQLVHFRPVESPLLAATEECPSPESTNPNPECVEAVEISGYRVVVEVTLHDRFEPCPGLRNGIVHTLAELLLRGTRKSRQPQHIQ